MRVVLFRFRSHIRFHSFPRRILLPFFQSRFFILKPIIHVALLNRSERAQLFRHLFQCSLLGVVVSGEELFLNVQTVPGSVHRLFPYPYTPVLEKTDPDFRSFGSLGCFLSFVSLVVGNVVVFSSHLVSLCSFVGQLQQLLTNVRVRGDLLPQSVLLLFRHV